MLQEICTLMLAVIFNGDQLNFINCLGLVLCFSGIMGHVGLKFMKSTREQQEPRSHSQSSIVQGPNSTSSSNAMNFPGSSGCESGEPLLPPMMGIDGDSDIENNDSWHR